MVPDVSIIITNYNYGKYISRCLRSCLNQERVLYEVIVVDDCSTDNSFEMIRPFAEQIRFLKTEKNSGVAAAANLGIQKVKTKYALLLNPDIKFLTKNPIYNFEQSIKQYSNVGMASCITCNENMEKENGRITFFSKIDKKILKDIIEIPEGNACSTISCVYGGAIIFFDVE